MRASLDGARSKSRSTRTGQARLARINRDHMEYFVCYLRRIRETRDGAGTLLDRTLVLRGSAFGDPNEHDFLDLPVEVAGGLVRGDRHVVAEKGTTMSNLLLAGLNLLDVLATSFGDSTGAMTGLARG